MNNELFDIPSEDENTSNDLNLDLAIDAEVETDFEPSILEEKPKKKRKPRKPMSDEAHQAMLERLKKGRETARKNRYERKKQLELERSETLRTLKELRDQVKEKGYKSINSSESKPIEKKQVSDVKPVIKKEVLEKPVVRPMMRHKLNNWYT
jgi:hypothetical protein